MRPLFISGQAGQLFSIFFPAIDNVNTQAIIHIPAFAEEMNKARQMVALQSRELSKQGYAVLILDLFGTGESSGCFGDATWLTWMRDIDAAITWLTQQGAQSISLWGLRTGALLALHYASQTQNKIDRMLFWQPIVNGEIFITQFLRLRVAAAMMDSNAPQEKTSELKQQLLAGQAIEVAGYILNPDLVKPLMALRAEHLDCKLVQEVAIFEVVSDIANPGAMANTQLLAHLHDSNIETSLTKVIGEPFWASQEISSAPDLIKASSEKTKEWLLSTDLSRI